jgi:hypothetical protein
MLNYSNKKGLCVRDFTISVSEIINVGKAAGLLSRLASEQGIYLPNRNNSTSLLSFPVMRSVIISAAITLNVMPLPPKPSEK